MNSEDTKTFIELTHANTNKKIVVSKPLIFAFYFSETHKCTLILATGGAMLPVKESEDEIKEKMRS
jgi:hypothetical protein